ncbi:hypothetical protein WJX73_001772 [Symbiochloris irregularis]|uniref:Ribosome biogenesis protein SLX9 n=1 Tax=Symbiochloris irregularis TaxID=706552 RepID=A0AAW1NTL3_9CHLO
MQASLLLPERQLSHSFATASKRSPDTEALSQDAAVSALLALSDHVPSKPAQVAKKKAAAKPKDQRVAEVKKRGRGRPRKIPNPEFATATAALREANTSEATAEAANRQKLDPLPTAGIVDSQKQDTASANVAAAKARLTQQLAAKLETAMETMQEQTKDMDDEAAEAHLRQLLSEGCIPERTALSSPLQSGCHQAVDLSQLAL